jgi:O-antigen/teichoic acid export membrane protein
MHPDHLTLWQRSLRALKWSVVGQGLAQIIRFCSSLIMTRLLVPDMFGVMAIVWTITFVLAMLSDVGLRQQAVQSHRGDDLIFLDTAWVVQIIRGLALWIVNLLLALVVHFANSAGLFPTDSVYTSQVLPSLMAVGGLTFVIAGFQSTRMWLADRNFDQKRRVQIELIAQVCALLVMIALGYATHSIWVLVLGSLVASLITTVLSHTWMSGHGNRFRIDKEVLSELRHFGKWIFISSAVSVFAAQGDRLLLGFLVDAETLGLYSIASLVIGVILTAVGKFSGTVSLPALSEVARSDPSKLRHTYYQLRFPIDVLLLFMTGLLYFTGEVLIKIFYDSRYSGAGDILQILALSLFTARYDVGNQAYLALGVPRYFAIINVVKSVSLYTFVLVLYWVGGAKAAIFGVAVHEWATLPFLYRFNFKLGLMSVRREAIPILALPLGALCGVLLESFVP